MSATAIASANAKHRRSAAYAQELWVKWPVAAQWPGRLDLYEAAAYLRVNYLTLWRACQTGRDGKARLSHQRIGSNYRIDRSVLDRFGAVAERSAA